MGLEVIGSQKYNSNIISISRNGGVIDWGDDITQIVREFNINEKENTGINCFCFPFGETNEFFVGQENASISKCRLHTQGHSSESHIDNNFMKHQGPIIGLDMHPKIQSKNTEVSNLLLSIGQDQGICLWNPKQLQIPYFSIETENEVYDIQWSPVHPSVFATCDGLGNIDLWDLTKD